MAKKKKLKYSLVMEYFPDEDRLEFFEEKIDEIDNIIITLQEMNTLFVAFCTIV